MMSVRKVADKGERMQELQISDLTESGRMKLADSLGIDYGQFMRMYAGGCLTVDQMQEELRKRTVRSKDGGYGTYKERKGDYHYRPVFTKTYATPLNHLLKQFTCCTIATHNGSSVRRQHNIRSPKTTDSQDHIEKMTREERLASGKLEIWADEPVREAYKRLFDEARVEYNEKMLKKHRRKHIIPDYFEHIRDKLPYENKKTGAIGNPQHTHYEMIIGIYGRKLNGERICDDETGKRILREFVDTWKERNPNLELIGAYYHADEEGEPHVHIDYVPWFEHNEGEDNFYGLRKATGIRRALESMGFVKGESGPETPQIQWERRENKFLEELCEKSGIPIWHPNREYKKHLETEEYKAVRNLENAESKMKLTTEDLRRLEKNLKNVEEFQKYKAKAIGKNI